MNSFHLLFQPAAAEGVSILKMVGSTGLVVQLVLILLIAMSVVTWAIIGAKWLQLKSALNETELFLKSFYESKKLDVVYEASRPMAASPVAHVFRTAYQDLIKLPKGQRVQKAGLAVVSRSISRASTSQTGLLESKLIFLATTASAAPFIGLFGTVWGIMDAFSAIGVAGSPNLAVVAPHIAEALIATAVGLFAAIPAVIGYNVLNSRIKKLEDAMEVFGSDLLNILEHYFASVEDGESHKGGH